MNENRIINVMLLIMIIILAISYSNDHAIIKKRLLLKDTQVIILKYEIPSFKAKDPENGLKEALLYYEIKYPEIVYAQAILETGHFKSKVYQNNNNLFGLYDSKNKKYYQFKHWSESIIAYKSYIQSKYNSDMSYYNFLKCINYAEDINYINKLKNLTTHDP